MTAPTVVGTATRTLISQPASAMAVGLSMLVDGDELAIVHRDVSDDLVVFGYQTGTARAYRLDELVQMVVIRQSCPEWCRKCCTDSDGVTRHGSDDDGVAVWLYRYDDPDGTVGPVLVGLALDDAVIELTPDVAATIGADLLEAVELAGGEQS